MHVFAIRNESDRHLIEEALGVRFEPHESLYRGGHYWLARLPDNEDRRIRKNAAAIEVHRILGTGFLESVYGTRCAWSSD